MKRATDQHKKDYAELVELVRSNNLAELRQQLVITSEDEELFDFYYKSLIATIVKDRTPYLSGICALHYGDDSWEDNVRMGLSVDVLGISWQDLAMLEELFDAQVKAKGITFQHEDEENDCRMEFIDQYAVQGIAVPEINC